MSPRSPSRAALAADLDRATTARGRERLGRFVAEGSRLVERALRAGATIEGVLLADSYGGAQAGREERLVRELAAAGVPLYRGPDAELDERTGERGEGALQALVRIPATERPLADVLGAGEDATRSRVTLLVLHEVHDPGNVGALLRTGLASGVAAAITVGASDPYHPRAVRTSRGSLFKLALLRRRTLDTLLEELQAVGASTLAAVVHGGTPLPSMVRPSRPVALLVGNEAFGLPPAVERRVELRVSIPMSDAVDSFSVNAAAAIVLYELGREDSRDPRLDR